MSNRPRVLVTRTADQADAFSQKLRNHGFTPVEFPAIQLEPLPWGQLDRAIATLKRYDWLVFTSGNAVEYFLRRVAEQDQTLQKMPKVAAVGSATARLLGERGITIDFMPDQFVGAELVLGLGDLNNKNVLLPRAKIGRPEITNLLRTKGANVTEVALYDTVTAVPTAESWSELNRGVAAITFTSPSSVRNFCKIMADNPDKLTIPLKKWLRQAVVVCIGPVTAEAASEMGFTDLLVPDEYTIDGMVQQLKIALLEVSAHD